jgi:peroxiredoxin
MHTRTSSLIVAALAGWLVSCGPATGGTGASGSPSDFTLEDIDGDRVHLSDYLGDEVILINFWATWCSPCAGELAHLQRMYEDYRDSGFVVLAVSMDGPESIAEVAPFARRHGLSFPVLLDEETSVVSMLNPKRAAPYNVLIGRDGTIVSAKEGFSAGDEIALEESIKRHLSGSARER